MSEIKLIISEVDGIITDGKVPIDELGNVPFKNINIDDLEVINKLKTYVAFVFLSSDNHISYNLFRRKNIPFYWAKKSKRDTLFKILMRYNVSAEEALYIGYKYSDIDCINAIPNAICPANANVFIKKNANSLATNAGEGVLSEVLLRYF